MLSVLSAAGSAQAQVTPASDGTGTTVTQSGNTFDIEGGTQSGGNLFHKFDELSIESTETANFTGDSSVFNIVGQVSGGNPSYIEGQVQVSGSDANLYLVNPAGVLFGSDAQLSLQGSFTATTADQIGFGEDVLDVLSTRPDYTQVTAAPSSFRFTDADVSAVVNQGDLTVAEGENITLMGGSVISEGTLSAPGGEVGLVAVGGESLVRFNTPGSLLSLEVIEGDIEGGLVKPTALPRLLTGKVGTGNTSAATELLVSSGGDVLLRGRTVGEETIATTGDISVESAVAPGGTVALIGESIAVIDGEIDASGESGGTVLIGGDRFDGARSLALPYANATTLDTDATIQADGRTGAGGEIVAVSRNTANIIGTLSATGTTQGGFIETSADALSLSGVRIDASGGQRAGTWLIDPTDIDIVSGASGVNEIDPAVIEAAIDAGTDVALTTSGGSTGDISLLSSINQTGASNANLTLTGRRFDTNGSTINLASTGQLTFNINAVNPEPTPNARSINRAITAIGTVAGDRTINLGAATYEFGGIQAISTDVNIVGDRGGGTILTALNNENLFDVFPTVDARLSNLTLTAQGSLTGPVAGGIRNAGNLTIENSLFQDNKGEFGAAISSLSGASLSVTGSRFINNVASKEGGAISASNNTVSIADTTFSGNVGVDLGGAVRVDRNATLTIVNSDFINNDAGIGGGVSVETSEATITNSRFSGNSSRDLGGGLYAKTGQTVDISGSTFDGNTSAEDGGAITLNGAGSFTITGSALINNNANDDGGGLHQLGGSAVLSNVRVENNTATDTGGGLYQFASADLTVIDSLLRGNQAGTQGGGLMNNSSTTANTTVVRTVFENNIAESGGGLFSRAGGTVTITDADFVDNEASQSDGGAIYIQGSAGIEISGGLFDDNTAVRDGGAVAVLNGDSLEITNSTFTNNTSLNDDGGGLFIQSNPLATVSGSTFDGNSAADDGGGIYAILDSQLNIRNTTLTNNTAGQGGGGLYSRTGATVTIEGGSNISNNSAQIGGGIALDNTISTPALGSELIIVDSVISDNRATQRGGGIVSLESSQAVTVTRTAFERNVAPEGGAIFSVSDGALNLNDATFEFNEAIAGDGGAIAHDGTGLLSVTTSDFTRNTSSRRGGAIQLSSGSFSDRIIGSTFSGNTANNNGGALSLSGADVLIESSTFDQNVAGDDGGAIESIDSSLAVVGTTLSQNNAGDDGAGLYASDARITLRDTTLEDNIAGDNGGGLNAESNSNVVFERNSVVTGNSAVDDGGGINITNSSSLTLTDSRIANNTAANRGGGIAQDAGNVLIQRSTLSANRASMTGGGLYLSGDAIATIGDATTFINNTAANRGGGAALTGNVIATLSDGVVFDRNVAGTDGGGIATDSTGALSIDDSRLFGNRAGADGGGIAQMRNSVTSLATGDIEITGNSTVTNNTAAGSGGGLSLAGGAALRLIGSGVGQNIADGAGGGIFISDASTVDVAFSGLRDNQAQDAGGAIANRSTDATVTVSSSSLSDNIAAASGGAIFSSSDSLLSLSSLDLSRNTAGTNGGAIALIGATSLDVSSALFAQNAASERGGAIQYGSSGSADVSGVQFSTNRADKSGGAISNVSANGVLSIENATFTDNFTDSLADNTDNDSGGAIFAATNSQTAISNSLLMGNQAEFGGAIAAVEFADITLQGSQLRDNTAAIDGGGIRATNSSVVTIEQSEISNNRARFGGGLELSQSSVANVVDSEFFDNEASLVGGGIMVDDTTRLTLSSATLSSNRAVDGAGLFVAGDATLTNATVSGNTASGEGGGIAVYGPNAALRVQSSTLTNNSASAAGGISVEDALSTAELLNTIVAGNTALRATSTDVQGQFIDGGNNLIGVASRDAGFTSSALVGSVGAPLTPGLAPLADNGGATKTHLLQSDSRAVNAVTLNNLPTTDQRGFARPAGAAGDIGAVEMDAGSLPTGIFNAIAPNAPVIPTPPVPTPTPPTSNPSSPNPAPISSPTLASLLSADSPSPSEIEDADVAVMPEKETLNADNVAIRRLEQTFGQSFEDYWDLSLGPDLSFDEVQAILRRAKEEYQVSSAVVYAIFSPEEEEASTTPDEESRDQNILTVESEPADDDLLNLSLVMPEGELVSYQLPYTREQVNRQVRLFRATVSDPVDDYGYQPFSRQVYQWLLAPLETDLAAQGIQNLMYALDTGLRTAPITAMKDDSGYSLERYGMSVVPNMGLMQADFGVPVRRPTIAMGVAEFESYEPLPAVPVELEMVSEFVSASQTVLNEGTTLEALEAVQTLEQPGVLHLATHADFDSSSPESSSIQLWENPLSMTEFRALDWRGSELEMLILSACSTAMSSPRSGLGFAGLAAASGVDATVGSLWQVSDVGTLALMSEFYAQLESTDLRVEALRRAQLALVSGDTRIENGNLITSRGEIDLPDEWDIPQEATLAHPFFWSAFTMVGNPW